MPYVRRGGSHARLNQLVAVMRAARNRGMGQDSLDAGGFTDSGIDAGGFPIDTTPVTVDTSPVPSNTGIVSSPSTPFDWSKLIQSLTGGAAAGSAIYRQLTPPSLVPGTNAIFNPATGQFYNPLTGQVVNPVGTSPTSNIPLAGLTSSPLLIGGLVLGAVVIVAVVAGKRSS